MNLYDIDELPDEARRVVALARAEQRYRNDAIRSERNLVDAATARLGGVLELLAERTVNASSAREPSTSLLDSVNSLGELLDLLDRRVQGIAVRRDNSTQVTSAGRPVRVGNGVLDNDPLVPGHGDVPSSVVGTSEGKGAAGPVSAESAAPESGDER